MKCWSDMKFIEGFFDKPFLMIGSGNSLSRINEIDLTQYNTVVLNYSNYYFDNAFIWSFADDWSTFNPDRTKKHKYMLTRSINYLQATDNTYIVEYDKDQKFINNKHLFKNEAHLPLSCSAAGIGLMFGSLGVKRIDTIGIDGGTERSELLPIEGYGAENYTKHNEGFYGWCQTFGIKTEKL